jgi:hypothetical protein
VHVCQPLGLGRWVVVVGWCCSARAQRPLPGVGPDFGSRGVCVVCVVTHVTHDSLVKDAEGPGIQTHNSCDGGL